MKHIRHLSLIILSAFLFVFAMSGCENTTEGIGEDLENAGEQIDDAAEDAQDE